MLEHDVATAARCAAFTEHPRFAEALAALEAGDVAALARLLDEHPGLARARTRLEPPYDYFTGATLLHHAAWNPSRDAPIPPNIAEVARLLLARGAEVEAMTLSRNAGTAMGLVVTSKQASDAGVSGALIDALLAGGARLDLGREALDTALANHAECAAERMIELGAEVDVCAAAALGRLDLVRAHFDGDHLRDPSARGGERDAIGLSLLFAYVRGKGEVVDFLLAKDGNWDMIGVNNGTALHRAAFAGDLAMVERLVVRGADPANRDNPFQATPLSWADHAQEAAAFAWLRAHTAVDLHDAVCFGLEEHVRARLAEDPSSVNARLDHWQVPRSTPLYWAARTGRRELVELLLAAGADPDLRAGDGKTAREVALAGVADLLR